MHHSHDTDIVFLLASLLALAAGPALLVLVRRRRALATAAEAITMAAVAGLVLLEILPEAVHVAGGTALACAALGLAVPVLAERRLRAAADGARRATPWLFAAALCLHALSDGLAIGGAGGHMHGHGDGLSMAVVLHRLPVGAALWWLLAPRGRVFAIGALTLVGLCTVAGFWVGESTMAAVGGEVSVAFQAFVAGLLLHVLTHRRASQVLQRALPWAVAGTLSVLALRPVLGDGEHGHEEHAGFTRIGIVALALIFARPLLAWRRRP